ncbi:phosphoribosylpyrophosphate synthetase [Rhizosphaericola mali]|uniref:Phosphoribosylpyrophosphate synthetase n=1 Tax=Rhizosphaericola mali TaxID=2545455 RepID=A0A5P2G3M1_9BACT|nr:phosphoribosylpyrophosphate synthetase [Rhizosphaericola mali]QES90075.1 phosphoribosylpyrophosphate synthetase [Rhizosphaericola mali]
MRTEFVFDNGLDAIEWLQAKGYTQNFDLNNDCIVLEGSKIYPTAFEIDHVFRFEDDSDPEEEEIIYGISSNTGDRGILVNAYGTYSDSLTDDMITKLKI